MYIDNMKQKLLNENDDSDDAEFEEFLIKVVTLHEGSWFGDYHILTGIRSDWELRVSKAAKSKKDVSAGKIGSGKMQVFKLNATKFFELAHNYGSDFRRFLLTRASLRRTHW